MARRWWWNLSPEVVPGWAEAWAGELLAQHGLPNGPLRRMQGWSNEIWASDGHVVRISSGRFEGSLTYEAGVLRALAQAPCPRVVAVGQVGRREWMIQTRAPGETLMRRWPSLDTADRQRAIRSLAVALRQVHATPLSAVLAEPPWRRAALEPGGDLSVALRVDPIHYARLVEANLRRKSAPVGLLRAAGSLIGARLGLFDGDSKVLTHGDLTFANLIWDGADVTLIDLESAGAAPIDRELDVLLRFLGEPGAFNPDGAEASGPLYEPVLTWLRDAYPALFAHPALIQRLEVYDALWELTQFLNYPPDHPRNTAERLEAILVGRAPWRKALAG